MAAVNKQSPAAGAPIGRRQSRRTSRRYRTWTAFGLLTVFLSVLGGLWLTDVLPRSSPVAPPSSSGADGSMISDAVEPASSSVPGGPLDHPVYRYSVVPGGVRSIDDVARVVARDPVVADHYASVNVADLRRERLTKPVRAHVSYRMGDKVYSTSRAVHIPAGEPVLTDGETTIRERCGNIISMAPLAPVADPEPPLEQLDLVMAPVAPPAHVSATNAPGGTPNSTPAFPFAGGLPPGVPPVGGFSSLPPSLLPLTFPPSTTTPPAGTPTTRTVDPPVGDPPDPTPTPTLTPTPTGTPTPTPRPRPRRLQRRRQRARRRRRNADADTHLHSDAHADAHARSAGRFSAGSTATPGNAAARARTQYVCTRRPWRRRGPRQVASQPPRGEVARLIAL